MKKSLLLLILLTILGAGTVYYANNTILEEKDKVNFKETVVYGDKSVVEGITVTMQNWQEDHLSWDSTYVIGEHPKVDTKYQCYPWGFYEPYRPEYTGSIYFNMDENYMNNLEWETMHLKDESEDAEGMERALWDLYHQIDAGEEKEITVKLKDYMEYYTFAVNFEGAFNRKEESLDVRLSKRILRQPIVEGYEVGLNTSEMIETEKYLDYLETFQEFFKIPVLEDEINKFAMKKNSIGMVVGFGASFLGGGFSRGDIEIPNYILEGDAFSFYMSSVADKGHCYFTFDTHTENGNIVDTSQIPGGYGIYHFPYDGEKQEIYPEELEMVYPLDTNIEVHGLFMDICEKNLVLITREDNGNTDYMYVIDKETLTLQEKFEVGNVTDGRVGQYWIYEDYMVLESSGIKVFTIDENGTYTLAFTAPTEVLNKLQIGGMEHISIPTGNMIYDWDGEKLVFANSIYNANWSQEAGFYIGAMDATGLLYLGTYESSLRTPDVPQDGYSICGPHRERAITISIP